MKKAVIKETLLICIGNPYREDDGAGLYIGQLLANRNLPGLKIVQNQNDGIAIIDYWTDRSNVIIADAVQSGKRPGAIHRFDALNTIIPDNIFQLSSHYFDIRECIALSRQLGTLPAKLTFYGIEAKKTGYGEQLSKAVQQAAAEVAQMIAAEFSNN